jgi:hypothetical protein
MLAVKSFQELQDYMVTPHIEQVMLPLILLGSVSKKSLI